MKLLNGGLSTYVISYRNQFNYICCRRHIPTITQIRSKTQMKWKPVVGLEIHAQIATKSKLFSAASTKFSDPINSCVALFDSAVPGTLPVLNKKCVEIGVKTALALSCKVNETSMFERKHYFYADMPAGFQITQQKKPLAINGMITFPVLIPGITKKPYMKTSKIKQIQLEQDSGRSLHDQSVGKSFIDLNRAGIPLMEFVFEPDLSNGEEAAALVKELMLVLQCLDACSCKMEEGAFRVDANVSVSKEGEPLGVRTEIKNIGSTRAIASAIQYEIKRHISMLENGDQIFNETLSWDSICKKTVLMREKEDKQDYRFMPETNLPPLRLHTDENAENTRNLVNVTTLSKQMPEMPTSIRCKFIEDFKISLEVTTAVMGDKLLLKIFRDIVKNKKFPPRIVANFLANSVLTFLYKHDLSVDFCMEHLQYFIETMELVMITKEINKTVCDRLIDKSLILSGTRPRQIVEENNWFIINDEKLLEQLCLAAMEKYPKVVRKYKAGKDKYLSPLIDYVNKETNNCADYYLVVQIFKRLCGT